MFPFLPTNVVRTFPIYVVSSPWTLCPPLISKTTKLGRFSEPGSDPSVAVVGPAGIFSLWFCFILLGCSVDAWAAAAAFRFGLRVAALSSHASVHSAAWQSRGGSLRQFDLFLCIPVSIWCLPPQFALASLLSGRQFCFDSLAGRGASAAALPAGRQIGRAHV